jgi:hypothetical protein
LESNAFGVKDIRDEDHPRWIRSGPWKTKQIIVDSANVA